MNWTDEEKILTERLEILNALKKRFGEGIIEVASNTRLALHQKWMRELAQEAPPNRPADIFYHSAFTVTGSDSDLLQYEVLEDSSNTFAVKITHCKLADFYRERGFPEIGYAMHCALDFDEATAFWPEIRLKRSKTIMRGDPVCDHCYELLMRKR